MTRRWERELQALKDVPAPLERIRERAARGHDGDTRMDLPPRRQRIVAGLVAFAVFAVAGTFAWRAFEGAPAPTVHAPSNELPVLSMQFDGSVGPIDDGSDGDLRRVNTVIDYGDVHEESFTSTTPVGAHVDWVVVDDVTVFTPGPAAGSRVAISADGEDPRVLIGSPQDWPNFERFDPIDRLPSIPGDYVLVFEADYPEGTAITARRVHVVEPGALQLSLIEGGGLDAARATAYVDGSGVEGFLSRSFFMVSDVGGHSAPRTPDFGTQEPLVVAEGAPLVLATPADAASAGLAERYALTPDHLPIDLVGQTSTLSSAPGIYLLAVDATWEQGKVGWASDGTRETARFFFPIEVVPPLEASPPGEPLPDPSVLVATLDAPEDGTMPGLTLESGGELEKFFAQGGKWPGVDAFVLPLLFFSPPLAPGATIRVEGDASEVHGELEVLDQDHRRTGEVLPLNLTAGSGALPDRPAFYMLDLEGT